MKTRICQKSDGTYDQFLEGYGRITTDNSQSMGQRTLYATTRLKKILDTVNGRLAVVLEQPPETIYKQASGINAVVQRSVSLFKVFLMLGAFFEVLNARGISYRTIQPSQWQDAEAKRIAEFGDKAVDTKYWTKMYAGKYLAQLFNYTDVSNKILADHNVCDGISIGIKCIEKYVSGTWHPPETSQNKDSQDADTQSV